MGIDTGAKLRLDILQRNSEQELASPFKSHGWEVNLISKTDKDCYLIYHVKKDNVEKN